MPAKILLFLIFQKFSIVKRMRDAIPVAADELAYRRVLAHDAHGLQFRGRVYGACDEMCQRSVFLYVAPALSPEESVYLNLPYCLQTYPFGAYITGIGVLQIHAFTNLSSVN